MLTIRSGNFLNDYFKSRNIRTGGTGLVLYQVSTLKSGWLIKKHICGSKQTEFKPKIEANKIYCKILTFLDFQELHRGFSYMTLALKITTSLSFSSVHHVSWFPCHYFLTPTSFTLFLCHFHSYNFLYC